jgi:ATP-binding cassette subfamily B protein
VVILDEATSALDPITESGVFDTLSRLSKESTIIAVTHRLNLALRAEVIFVVEEGRIVASGSHEMLIQQSDLYAKLWLDNKDETKTTSCKSG